MRRAGTLFADLTGGSYSALGQAFDEEDVPRLIGTRPTGEQVHIAGMSDGARDQLYLALRLAYLEDYASRSEPIPFIGDDIFMTFDDARTKNGILALAAIGEKVQPILFTHHQYVVDLALEALGEGVNILKLGTGA